MSKKKICIDDSQLTRLLTDTTKMAKGDNSDICPTVEEMVKEHVPADVRLGKAKLKKKEKDFFDKFGDHLTAKAAKKAKKSLVDKIGSLGDWI